MPSVKTKKDKFNKSYFIFLRFCFIIEEAIVYSKRNPVVLNLIYKEYSIGNLHFKETFMKKIATLLICIVLLASCK